MAHGVSLAYLISIHRGAGILPPQHQSMTEDQHVRVHSRCGACGSRFSPGDTFYACENPDFVSSGRITIDMILVVSRDIFGRNKFPESGYCDNQRDHPWMYCRLPDCRQCRLSPDSGTIHAHCLKLFLSEFKGGGRPRLRWLWLAATWRSPWQGALPLDLEPYVGYQNPFGILDKLPRMLLLPPELRLAIWEFCASSPLWITSAVLDLRVKLAASKQQERSVVALTDIESWARGCPLEYRDTPDSPIIHITFDSQGLRRIKRLSERPPRSSSGSDFHAFVVESVERFSGVLVEFEVRQSDRLTLTAFTYHSQLGLARLQLPAGEANGFYIWDTPSPPPLERCMSDLSKPPSSCHLGTLQLRACSGITFFMSRGSIHAVHAHTLARPFAQSTFETLPTARQRIVSWVYVPIDGEITKFGFSQVSRRAGNVTRSQSLLVRYKVIF